MRPIKVILTASGFFGGNTLVENLRSITEREINIIGTDSNCKSASRFYCDEFYVTPDGESQSFIKTLKEICIKEKPDVILPASSCEVSALSNNKKEFEKLGVQVMVSDPQPASIALNKASTYHKLDGIIGIPKHFYSGIGFCVKPPRGKGSRDIKIFDDKDYLVMEKLEGEEIDVDVLSKNKEVLLIISKVREKAYGGTLREGTVVSRPYIEEQIRKIVNIIPLDFLSVIQFKGGKLLEINPRISGAMPYFSGWNMPYLAIKLALGEITPQEIKTYQDKIKYGLKITRYLNQIHYE